MGLLLNLHSVLRWVVVVVAVVVLVMNLMTWLGKKGGEADRKAMAAFVGMLDLQFLLGIILLLWMGLGAGGGFPMYRIEHATTMFIAVAVGHASAMWKKRDAAVRARNNFFIALVVLALIWAGVSRLPQGWL